MVKLNTTACYESSTGTGTNTNDRQYQNSKLATNLSAQNATRWSWWGLADKQASPPCTSSWSSATDPAIWRYNMKTHFHNHHPTVPWVTYEAQFKISDAEKAGMELLWQKRLRIGKTKAQTHHTACACEHQEGSAVNWISWIAFFVYYIITDTHIRKEGGSPKLSK
jgi:hypothetical protein